MTHQHKSGNASVAHASDVAVHMAKAVADTYVLAVKTHGAHWNVKGPGFFKLHIAFEKQYRALFKAADTLAERLRALGHDAPGSMRAMLDLSAIGEAPSDHETDLVRALRDDHRTLSTTCKEAYDQAHEEEDEATADILLGRIEAHDKIAWMLSATLGDS